MKLIDLTGLQEFGNNVRNWVNAHFQRKVNGKGLSTYDYDKTAKDKVDAIPADPKYTDTVYDDTDLSNRVNTIEGKESGWNAKQEALVSGTNIKTINNETILGEGNIAIQGGGGEENVIEAITMNGVSVPVTNKTASITETDPTVPSWAKQSSKPSYTQDEVVDGTTYKRVSDAEKSTWNSKGTYSKPSGGIPDSDIASASTWNAKYTKPSTGIPASDLASGVIPTVPTKLSDLTDDLGSSPTHTHSQYLTSHQSLSGYAKYVLCADEAAYNAISSKQSDTLYLIPES